MARGGEKVIDGRCHLSSFLNARLPADARVAGPDSRELERRRILERYQIHYPFLLYVGHIRPQKNIPR